MRKLYSFVNRLPRFPKKILKNTYALYNNNLLVYKYLRYKKLYNYPVIYIAAGNRTASTWLRDVLAYLIDGFTAYHPKKHPRADEGGNYDIDRELIEEVNNRLFVIRSHTPPKPSNVKIMNEHFGKYLATVRDIRDVIVSLANHIEKHPKTSAFINFGLTRKLPWKTILPEELKLEKEQFIDLLIERLLPGILSISEGWVDYSLKNENVKIIRYEDLVKVPASVIKNILRFYNISKSDLEIESALEIFNPEKDYLGGKDLSRGRIGIWQQQLSYKQLERCEEIGKKFLNRMRYLSFKND